MFSIKIVIMKCRWYFTSVKAILISGWRSGGLIVTCPKFLVEAHQVALS